MHLHVLPTRIDHAAANMAADFLLMQRFAPAEAARFRHYGWRRPAWTFGYGQKIAEVRPCVSGDERIDLTRRPTGGGIVDHRADWTYALVLPRQHPLFDRPGPTIYQAVHTALAAALNDSGTHVALARAEPAATAGVCFVRPELHDLVRTDDGRKVAGAALKRGKHAILLQGSIARETAREIDDWAGLGSLFVRALARELTLEPVAVGWPEFNPDEEEALVEQYASPEWIERR